MGVTELRERMAFAYKAVAVAKGLLVSGDRVRVTKCPGTERTFTFDHWDGIWMVSRSGICDYSPSQILRVNGRKVDMAEWVASCDVDVSDLVEAAMRPSIRNDGMNDVDEDVPF